MVAPAPYIPQISHKQAEVYNNYFRYLLVHGPRKCGKSIGILNKLVRHAVENDGAMVGVISKSKTTSQVGAWKELTNEHNGIIAQWIKETNGAVDWIKKPRYQQDTKTAFCSIRNAHGGESEFQLHSANDTSMKAIEDRFKDTNFTMIYIVEADKFPTRNIVDGLTAQLRSMHVPSENFQMILDTNPPRDGEEHWLFDMFFVNPTENHAEITFTLDDNPYITKDEKQTTYNAYAHDKNMLDRYYYGKWVKVVEGAIFESVFQKDFHVVPCTIRGTDMDDHLLLRPTANTWLLEAGWDLGDVNHGCVLGFNEVINSRVVYNVIDEVVYRDSRVTLDEFTDDVLEKMDYWEAWMMKRLRIQPRWSHMSDTSSMRYKASLAGDEAQVIYRRSRGRIVLRGATKGSGSVPRRVDLVKRMLHSSELFISEICTHVIDCIEHVKPAPPSSRANTGDAVTILKSDPRKHVFDALTYMLSYGRPYATVNNTPTDSMQPVTMSL